MCIRTTTRQTTNNSINATHRINVFTLAALMPYSLLTACLIWFLLLVISTMKTKVLLSSIFFMADSVVNGNLITLYESFFGAPAATFATFGFLASLRVFGLKKCVFVWTLVAFLPLPFFRAFAALLALATDINSRSTFLYLLPVATISTFLIVTITVSKYILKRLFTITVHYCFSIWIHKYKLEYPHSVA